jgi:hypothetical protein
MALICVDANETHQRISQGTFPEYQITPKAGKMNIFHHRYLSDTL